MKNTILRILIGAILSALITGIVVSMIGLMLGGKLMSNSAMAFSGPAPS